jgi:hypothetical protein
MSMYSNEDADGVEADTFCHIVDAWVEGEMARGSSDDKVNKGIDSLEPFRRQQGDRFANADALAKAMEEWAARSGGRGRNRTAHRVLADLLSMWRSLESMSDEDEE